MTDPSVVFFATDHVPVAGSMPSCCQLCPELSLASMQNVTIFNQLDATIGYDKIAIPCSVAGAKERPMAYIAPVTASYSITVLSGATLPLAFYVLHTNCYGADFNGCTTVDPAAMGSQIVSLQAGERIVIVVEQASTDPHAYPFMLAVNALPTPTPSHTGTVTLTATRTPTRTRTATATVLDTATATLTRTSTRTATRTRTATATRTVTPTTTITNTAPATATRTATSTTTPSRSATATHTASPTAPASPTRTGTATLTATGSATATRTATASATGTVTPTATPVNTTTSTATITRSATVSVTPTPTRTHSGTPSATATSTHSRTRTASASPSATPSASPTAPTTAADTVTVTPTPTATARGGFASAHAPSGNPAAPLASGHFSPRTPTPGGTPSPRDAVDLVVGGRDAPLLHVLSGHGDGSFAAPSEALQLDGMGGLADLAVADVDGDGRLDVVATDPTGDRLLIARGDDTQGLRDGGTVAVGSAPQRVVVAQVTDDGIADALVATADGVDVLRGRGDGSFEVLDTVATGGRAADLALADIDADGDLDLLTAVPAVQALLIFLGNGDGTFAPGPRIVLNEPVALAVAELSGDTRRDVAVTTAGDQALVLLAGGPHDLEAPRLALAGIRAARLVPADIDRDGRIDLVALDPLGGGAVVLFNTGGGRFVVDARLPADEAPAGLTVADFSGDGLPDVAVTAPDASAVVIGINITAAGPPLCPGDCDGDREVEINELIAGVNIALGQTDVVCAAIDTNVDDAVSIAELISAVSRALRGCGESA